VISHPCKTVPTIEYVGDILVRMIFARTLDFHVGHPDRHAPVRADKFINTCVFTKYSVFSGKDGVIGRRSC
jgi:hypothetical protein